MPKDRDQLTPDDPEDADKLLTNRGQGTGGTGLDELSPTAEVDDLDEQSEEEDDGSA